MQDPSSAATLRASIQWLQEEQSRKAVQLKEHFYLTYESLKPIHLLKTAVRRFMASSAADALIGSVMGLAAGYVAKKLIVGASGNTTRRLIGAVVQLGVSSLVSQNQAEIKAFGKFAVRFIMGPSAKRKRQASPTTDNVGFVQNSFDKT